MNRMRIGIEYTINHQGYFLPEVTGYLFGYFGWDPGCIPQVKFQVNARVFFWFIMADTIKRHSGGT